MSQDARLDEEQSTRRRAGLIGLPYSDTSKLPNTQLFKDLLSPSELESFRVVPMVVDRSNILFGITTSTPQTVMQSLRQRFNDQRVAYTIISDTGFKDYMKLYNPPKKITYQDVSFNSAGLAELVKTISATLDQVRADDILAYLVKQAYQLKASDIHLENQENGVRIRFRVDGVLHPIANLSKEKYHQLMSSIAIAANVSTSDENPQSGHINTTYKMATGDNVTVNLRVETVPTAYGQDAVMRLFNLRMELLDLNKLGLSESERHVVDDIINHPTGMVLVVGPTGSGKTTTLYSLINTLNTDERKILTLEDPIEYYLNGVVQIPVSGDKSAKSFGDMLRATLRLDPDVLMVGEIRDQDTAKTALQAALTGHLVLSTFHASSASAALTRMIDLVGINPLFASAIRLIMAQRLIRRLDDKSKQPYQPTDAMKVSLQQVLDSMPPHVPRPDISNLTLYKPAPSSDNPFGYTGQIAIREQLRMTPGVQEILKTPTSEITTDTLQLKAIADGMLTMLQDGILKVIAGVTTIEEIYRVVD